MKKLRSLLEERKDLDTFLLYAQIKGTVAQD